MSHYCACRYHSTIPNSNALQNHCACADPDTAPDPDRAADKRLIGYAVPRLSSMIMVRDVAEWADKTVPPHLNAFRRIKHSKPVYIRAFVNNQSRAIAS